jgi:hypothetical protein
MWRSGTLRRLHTLARYERQALARSERQALETDYGATHSLNGDLRG